MSPKRWICINSEAEFIQLCHFVTYIEMCKVVVCGNWWWHTFFDGLGKRHSESQYQDLKKRGGGHKSDLDIACRYVTDTMVGITRFSYVGTPHFLLTRMFRIKTLYRSISDWNAQMVQHKTDHRTFFQKMKIIKSGNAFPVRLSPDFEQLLYTLSMTLNCAIFPTRGILVEEWW